ncbi:metal ABC transporter ATP-binding protein [Nitrincola tapanii]|uniref:ATP-binding cassette domain-containing protein n=1 Tax=Nitrincola tapanii TaxID=1708751 RepID=A0A5A9W3S5_9GAMM|nr:ATP-binding cassette domain-containing protein [Nitrincola tapanii]KAA0875357.1 ATP-binding cassette domain-containing protein [Nitrincola tapanii]
MSVSLEVQKLRLALNRVELIAPMDAWFAPGQMHVLMGPNGAGKSSLLKCLLGLLPFQGKIYRHWQAGAPRTTAYVPQQIAFEATLPLTIQEYLLMQMSSRPFFLRPSASMLTLVEQLLERVGLEGKAQLRLGQLSGGERQRLLFAQALRRPCALWCLDEPMTGLDELGQAHFTQLLQELRDAGHTLIVIHHDQQWIHTYADQVWEIAGGLVGHSVLRPALKPCVPERLNVMQRVGG